MKFKSFTDLHYTNASMLQYLKAPVNWVSIPNGTDMRYWWCREGHLPKLFLCIALASTLSCGILITSQLSEFNAT